MQSIWLKLELKLKNGDEQQRIVWTVEDAQVNESDLGNWKSNARSSSRHKELKEAEETLPSLVFICCEDIIYLFIF